MSKEWKIWPKMHFLVFALFVGNFSNKYHYNLLKILRIFCFWYFYPKWLILKLFVFKVDLCIKVVTLIKITTVYQTSYFTHQKLLEVTCEQILTKLHHLTVMPKDRAKMTSAIFWELLCCHFMRKVINKGY